MCVGVTCCTGGLCSAVEVVTVVWTAEPCLIMAVGVTGQASSDAPGACRMKGVKHMTLCKWNNNGTSNDALHIFFSNKYC